MSLGPEKYYFLRHDSSKFCSKLSKGKLISFVFVFSYFLFSSEKVFSKCKREQILSNFAIFHFELVYFTIFYTDCLEIVYLAHCIRF